MVLAQCPPPRLLAGGAIGLATVDRRSKAHDEAARDLAWAFYQRSSVIVEGLHPSGECPGGEFDVLGNRPCHSASVRLCGPMRGGRSAPRRCLAQTSCVSGAGQWLWRPPASASRRRWHSTVALVAHQSATRSRAEMIRSRSTSDASPSPNGHVAPNFHRATRQLDSRLHWSTGPDSVA